METTNSTEIEFKPQEVFVIEWNSIFFPYVKYCGYIKDHYGRNGRRLMSLGRTPEEATELSYNKQYGNKIWRIATWIKQNG